MLSNSFINSRILSIVNSVLGLYVYIFKGGFSLPIKCESFSVLSSLKEVKFLVETESTV